MNKKAESAAATRAELVRAAREVFTRRGFNAASLDEIVERAGVTKGALYHHFDGKQALFAAVLDIVTRELAEQVFTAASRESEPEAALRLGCGAFLDACLDKSVQRIMLMDGPAVLPWAQWRSVEERHGLALLRGVLEEGMEAGQFREQPAEPLARILLGALTEAGRSVARARSKRSARQELGAAIEQLLDGLGGESHSEKGANRRRSPKPR